MPIIQAVMISGQFIEKAKWQVKSLADLKIGHTIQVNLPVTDQYIIEYMMKESNPKRDCHLEKDGKSHSITLSFQILNFRYMLDGENSDLQSMALIQPANRTVEAITTYLLSENQCDPRFIHLLRHKS
jgi:hypothetical protein